MYEIVDLNAYHNGLWLYELLATWMAPRIPSVVRRDGRVNFVFIDPEKTEVLEDERHKWRRWLGRMAVIQRELLEHSGMGIHLVKDFLL